MYNGKRSAHFRNGTDVNGRVFIGSRTRGFILIGSSEDLSGTDTGLKGALEIVEVSGDIGASEAMARWKSALVVAGNGYWVECGKCGEIVAASRGRLGTAIKAGFRSNGSELEYQGA
jgi:hypothetical protein